MTWYYFNVQHFTSVHHPHISLPTRRQFFPPNLRLRDLKSDEILHFLEKHKFSFNFSLRDIRQLRQAAKDAAKLEEAVAVQQRGANFDERKLLDVAYVVF